MNALQLRDAMLSHRGTFRCSRIQGKDESKVVEFSHSLTPPTEVDHLPEIGKLKDFYAVVGSVEFYLDPRSGDSARYIASPAQWPELHQEFSGWLSHLDESERDEYLPDWIDSCLVLGEEPHSGNYILMPTEGSEAGSIVHFEHDGFEFIRQASDILQYAEALLDLNDSGLAYIATHMRFVEDDYTVQWWIQELRDNRGNIAKLSTGQKH